MAKKKQTCEITINSKIMNLTLILLFGIIIFGGLHFITDSPIFGLGVGALPFVYILCLIIICRPTEEEKCTK
jgi:Na+/alanine symporter